MCRVAPGLCDSWAVLAPSVVVLVGFYTRILAYEVNSRPFRSASRGLALSCPQNRFLNSFRCYSHSSQVLTSPEIISYHPSAVNRRESQAHESSPLILLRKPKSLSFIQHHGKILQRLSADDKSFLHVMPFLCDGHVFLPLLMICKPSIKHGRPRRYPPLVVTGCRYSRVRHVIRTAVLGYYSGSSHMMCTIDVMAQ